MTMPEVNPHPRGTLEWAQWERDHQTASGGGTTNNRPTAQNVVPGGTWAGPPGQPGSIYTAPNPAGGFLIQTVQQDGTLSTQASGARLNAASGGSGGTATRDFTAEKAATQQAQGGTTALPPGAIQIAPTRALAPDRLTVITLDSNTGVWVNSGFPPNPQDKYAAARALASGGTPATATATTGQTPTATQPLAPIDPLATPLRPNQAPSFTSALFSQGNRPGAMVPWDESMIRGGNAATNALNALTVQSRSMQGSGPVVQGAASLGSGRGNIEFTRGGQGSSRSVAAERQFPDIDFMVRGDYNPKTGMDTDGTFRPVDVAYNISSPTLDPLSPGGGLGGAATMTLSGPQTAHINNMSTGFNPNAMPASNIGLTYGRDFSGLDPVSQMVATAALMDDREKLMEMGYGPQGAIAAMTAASPSTWEGDGPGFRSFARGGRVVIDPLARYASGGSLVTNEPIIGIGMMSKMPRFMVGEDNADRDMMPDPEMLRFHRNGMQVIPLDPPKMAEGGTVTLGSPLFAPMPVFDMWAPARMRAAEAEAQRIAELRKRNPMMVATVPMVSGFGQFAEGGTITTGGMESFDPLDSSILLPWQAEAQRNVQRQHQRTTIDDPRRRAAGLGASTGVPVLTGDAPTTPLGPGQFYDTSGQVNRQIGNIVGAQEDLLALGPGEAVEPLYGRVGEVGTFLDYRDRIRSLEMNKVAAQVADEAERQEALSRYNSLAVQSQIAEDQYQAAALAWEQLAPYAYDVNYSAQYAKAYEELQAAAVRRANVNADREASLLRSQSVSPQLTAIDTQIAELMSLLPEGSTEAQERTELATLNTRISRQQQRQNRADEIRALRALKVPSLSAPLQPIDPLKVAA